MYLFKLLIALQGIEPRFERLRQYPLIPNPLQISILDFVLFVRLQ